jgi:hypothetical protein
MMRDGRVRCRTARAVAPSTVQHPSPESVVYPEIVASAGSYVNPSTSEVIAALGDRPPDH